MSNNLYNHFGYLFIMHRYIFMSHDMYCLLYMFVHYKSDLGGIYELYAGSCTFFSSYFHISASLPPPPPLADVEA